MADFANGGVFLGPKIRHFRGLTVAKIVLEMRYVYVSFFNSGVMYNLSNRIHFKLLAKALKIFKVKSH